VRNYHGAEIAWANRLVQTAQVNFGRVKYTPGGYCGPRRQRDYELVVLHSGGAQVEVDNETLVLPAEHAVLFLPGHQEHFVFSAKQETEHVWCSIRPPFVPADLRWRLARAPRMVPCSELMHRLFAAAQGCRRVTSLAAGRVVEHLGLALFAEYLHRTTLWPQRAQRSEELSRAMACIEEHFGEEDCLARARRAAQCSESGLNQRFRRDLGTSPARYLWLTRVERGIALLRDTGLTVAEISERCGCKNPFHFSRLVKRSQGISPREVRRQAWQ
jgi:AraC-like DNA-binding protein